MKPHKKVFLRLLGAQYHSDYLSPSMVVFEAFHKLFDKEVIPEIYSNLSCVADVSLDELILQRYEIKVPYNP